jgi:hypothetical protein
VTGGGSTGCLPLCHRFVAQDPMWRRGPSDVKELGVFVKSCG